MKKALFSILALGLLMCACAKEKSPQIRVQNNLSVDLTMAEIFTWNTNATDLKVTINEVTFSCWDLFPVA